MKVIATNAAGTPSGPGSQRLSLAKLSAWESLGYGMFLCFGMSTFLDRDDTNGTAPPSTYHPDRLDVGQWVRIARDAGMKYVVLTAKHVAGHCLWPSRYTDYTVASSGDQTDVVAELVKANSDAAYVREMVRKEFANTAVLRQLEELDDETLLRVMQGMEKGVWFGTAVFDGAQESEIKSLLKLLSSST